MGVYLATVRREPVEGRVTNDSAAGTCFGKLSTNGFWKN